MYCAFLSPVSKRVYSAPLQSSPGIGGSLKTAVLTAVTLCTLNACGGGEQAASTPEDLPELVYPWYLSFGGEGMRLGAADNPDTFPAVDVTIFAAALGESLLQIGQVTNLALAQLVEQTTSFTSLRCEDNAQDSQEYSIEWLDRDSDGSVNPGDQIKLEYDRCSMQALGAQVSGSVSMMMRSGTLDASQSQTSMEFFMTLRSLSISDTLPVSGTWLFRHTEHLGRATISVHSTETPARVSMDAGGAPLTVLVSEFSAEKSLSYPDYGNTFAYSGRFDFPQLDAFVELSTDTPFSGSFAEPPSSGGLTLTGGAGTQGQLRARPVDADLEFRGEYDGDGLFDDDRLPLMWTEVLIGSSLVPLFPMLESNYILPPFDVRAEVLELPGEGHALEAGWDFSNVYVSLPNLGDVVRIDPASFAIAEHIAVGPEPRGMHLGWERLHVARRGGLSSISLRDGSLVTLELGSVWDAEQGWDVSAASPIQLLISAKPDAGRSAYLASVEYEPQPDGYPFFAPVKRALDGESLQSALIFAPSEFGSPGAYAAQLSDPAVVYEFDGVDLTPVATQRRVLETSISSEEGPSPTLTLSDMQNLVFTSAGQALDTTDLSAVGNIVPGPNTVLDEHIIVSQGNSLIWHSLATLKETQRLRHNCPDGATKAVLATGDAILILRGDYLCRVLTY